MIIEPIIMSKLNVIIDANLVFALCDITFIYYMDEELKVTSFDVLRFG